MKLYLIGPFWDAPKREEYFAAFNYAARRAKDVLNASNVEHPLHLATLGREYADAMKDAVRAMMACDAVLLTTNALLSPEGMALANVAYHCGLTSYTQWIADIQPTNYGFAAPRPGPYGTPMPVPRTYGNDGE